MYIVRAGFGVFLLTCSFTILDSIGAWEAKLRARAHFFLGCTIRGKRVCMRAERELR